jgi:hypothetical protein
VAVASAVFDFIGMKLRYGEYKSAIIKACVYPLELFGKYIMSAIKGSLGLVGVNVCSFPTGMFLYSTFLVWEDIMQDFHIFPMVFLACGW